MYEQLNHSNHGRNMGFAVTMVQLCMLMLARFPQKKPNKVANSRKIETDQLG